MGICIGKSLSVSVLPTISKSNYEEDRRKRCLAEGLVQLRRLEEAPALVIATSKLYQSRKKWKSEGNEEGMIGKSMEKTIGSIEAVHCN